MQYAYFDPNSRRVLGWIDTEAQTGDLPPADLLIELSPDLWEQYADTDCWVNADLSFAVFAPIRLPSLELIKANKLADLSAACAEEIVAGFKSCALGDAYTYPSKATDQSNLMAAVLASLTASADGWQTPIWCVSAEGVEGYVPHSAAQVQTLGNDSLDARNACLAKKARLDAAVQAAKGSQQVSAITWLDPDPEAATAEAA